MHCKGISVFGHRLTGREKRLLEERTLALQLMLGLTPQAARKQAREDIRDAIAQSRAQGQYGVGAQGRRALQNYQTNPALAEMWEAMKRAGVRDEDVIEWWNIPDIERRLMLMDDDVFRVTAYLSAMDDGATEEQAGRLIWKMRPMFGDPTAPPTFPDDGSSTLLPFELKLRFMRWSERIEEGGGVEAMQAEREPFSTMNGYVRQLIREGRL